MKFLIYANGEVIGWSPLNMGDPPMGVASGRFYPSDHYSTVQPIFGEYWHLTISDQNETAILHKKIEDLNLSVATEQGEVLEPIVGIHIVDPTDEFPDEDLEVNVFGIDEQIYRKYFNEQIQAYQAYFGAEGRA